MKDVLRRRAERLATPEPSRTERFEDLVVFSLGAERYALRLSEVRAVLRDEVAPMPGVPDWIAGATNLRGALVSVLNLHRLLGLKDSNATQRSLLLLETNRGPVACRVDGLPELQRVAESELQASSGRPGLHGVVAGRIAWLDINAVLEMGRGMA